MAKYIHKFINTHSGVIKFEDELLDNFLDYLDDLSFTELIELTGFASSVEFENEEPTKFDKEFQVWLDRKSVV